VSRLIRTLYLGKGPLIAIGEDGKNAKNDERGTEMKVRRNDCDLFRYGPDITQKEENNKTILARIAVANQDVSTINLLRRSGKAMKMEAIRTTEKSVYFHETTRNYIPESCNLRK
jgi:hypothetical protein